MKQNKLIDHIISLRDRATAECYLTNDTARREELKELIAGYNDILNWLIWKEKNNVDFHK